MGIIALVAFWALAVRFWLLEGPKIPLIFMGLWVLGFFGFPFLGIAGYFFLAFEAILAVILILIEKYNEAF